MKKHLNDKNLSRPEMIAAEALIKEGIAAENWRFEIEYKERGFEFVTMEITVYQPRCQNPTTVWEAPYSMCRNRLYWCDAKLMYNQSCDR